ncbi:MAG: DUF4349 domain-containing protein [Sphingobacteriales bacterium]|nr:DUF4349 domain-containing protein [Sphingobacteriales bacterium]OJW30101.1 MAG: hypothetical protein BGO54_00450 [Sphingobacteriales bacterium 46-32]
MKKILLPALLAGLILVACNNMQEKRDVTVATDQANTPIPEMPPADQPGPDQQAEKQKIRTATTATATTSNPDWDRHIIRTARLKLEIKELKQYYSVMRDRIRGMGGYIASEELTENDFERQLQLSIRIPVDQFDAALEAVSIHTEKTLERHITSQDVSEELVDTRARLQTKEQMRERYKQLLGQSNKLDDILKMETEINQVQEQIERGAGRIQFLQHAAAYSTIELSLIQKLGDAPAAAEPESENALLQAIRTGWSFMRDLLLALISIWPLWLIAALIYMAIRRHKHKVSAKGNTHL